MKRKRLEEKDKMSTKDIEKQTESEDNGIQDLYIHLFITNSKIKMQSQSKQYETKDLIKENKRVLR